MAKMHYVNFRKKKVQKRYLAKPGFEPVTTRVSTGGCLNHSATELVLKLMSSLEI